MVEYPEGLLIPSATGLPPCKQPAPPLIRQQEQASCPQSGQVPIRRPNARPGNGQLADQIAQMEEDCDPYGAPTPDAPSQADNLMKELRWWSKSRRCLTGR